MIASSILLDYMFFERDDGLCHYNARAESVRDPVLLLLLLGHAQEVQVPHPLKGGGGGGGGGPPRAEDGPGRAQRLC